MECVDDWIVLSNQDFMGMRKLVRGPSVYGKQVHAYISKYFGLYNPKKKNMLQSI